MNVVYGVVWA